MEASKLLDLHPLGLAQTSLHVPGPALRPWWWENSPPPPQLVLSEAHCHWVERGLDTNRNDKGKGRRKTGFPSVGASLPGVGWVTHLGLAASAPQPEVPTPRSQERGTLGSLSPAFSSHLLHPRPSICPPFLSRERARDLRGQTTALAGEII